MLRYQVTVNGQVFEVNVEPLDGTAAAPVAAAPAPVPASASSAAPIAAAEPAAPAVPSVAGGTAIESPMPGKILKVMVSAGSQVTKGQTVMILEAMKMENEIPSPCDGTVGEVCVSEGTAVNTGDVLARIS